MKLISNKKSNNKFSRRKFCKNTAIATSGILAASLPLKSMGHVHENKTLKLAVVGCGGRGSGAAVQALNADENVELVAMADAFKDRVAITAPIIWNKIYPIPSFRPIFFVIIIYIMD